MTKKQHKAIAQLWAAGYIRQLREDSFEGSYISKKAAAAIVKQITIISDKLIKGRAHPFSLTGVIRSVLNDSKKGYDAKTAI
jgi:hypothetical protein